MMKKRTHIGGVELKNPNKLIQVKLYFEDKVIVIHMEDDKVWKTEVFSNG